MMHKQQDERKELIIRAVAAVSAETNIAVVRFDCTLTARLIMLKRHLFIAAAVTIFLAMHVNSTLLAQGTIFGAAGPVNRSMGGASVAAPIDSIGAIFWNPASISGMESSETAFGLGLLIPNHTVTSSIGGVGGSTEADAGIFPIPNIGWVHHVENSKLTFGLGEHGGRIRHEPAGRSNQSRACSRSSHWNWTWT